MRGVTSSGTNRDCAVAVTVLTGCPELEVDGLADEQLTEAVGHLDDLAGARCG